MDKEISDELIFLNPFIDASHKAINWSSKISKHMQDSYLLCRISETEKNSRTLYYNATGECITCAESGNYEVNKTYDENVLIYESFSNKGAVVKEKFYSPSGLCIAIREWDEQEKKQKCFLLFDYSIGFVVEYENTFSWCISWINSTISENQPEKTLDKSIVICDGPGSAPKLKHISTTLAQRYYVLHNNHKHSNGKLTKRDETNLKSMHTIDGVIALTPQHLKDLIADYPNGKFHSIPNFTKIKDIKLDDDFIANRIGFFGQLIDRKGVKDAIDAISIIKNKYNTDTYLEIYGIAPSDQEKVMALYSNYAKEKNIAHLVNFNGYSSDVFHDMRKCACVIFPSYSEAQGLTVIESLANGIPVVAYNCNYGPAAMIENGENGYLVDTGDREELAKKILDIITDGNLRKRLSNNAKTSAIEFSDSNKIYDSWIEAFNKTN
ncbi:glycosyltransferase [Rahnella woolbedingensis]|nr:glycosyltransferase [Rahnella woolbedingensis]